MKVVSEVLANKINSFHVIVPSESIFFLESNQDSIILNPNEDIILLFKEILGDINEDGELNIQDILFIVGLVLELGYPADYHEIADMNQDGVLNIQDIILIIDIILGN